MIEYRSKVFRGLEWREDVGWSAVPGCHTIANCIENFSYLNFKIQGKVYKSYSKPFARAFEQERVWEKLSG